MQIKRTASLVCRPVWLVAILLFGSAGCDTMTAPSTGRSPGSAPGMTYYMIVESVPAGATVLINGEERGVSPVQVRVALNQFGQIPEDIDITLEWPDGRPDTIYKLLRNTPPSGAVRINANGALVN